MVQVDGVVVSIISALIVLLLSVIAFFIARLIDRFDALNATVQKIDRDLSLDIGVVKADYASLKQHVVRFDPIWDRLRTIETDVASIKAGGCGIVKRCEQ